MPCFSSRTSVFIHAIPVDMRKGWDGLLGLARSAGFDVLKGDLFLFVSRDFTRAKVLFWDGTGLNLWCKRMERGRLANVLARGTMTATELTLFMSGAHAVKVSLAPRDLTSELRA